MHLAMDVAGTFDYYPSLSAVTAATAARAEGADGLTCRRADDDHASAAPRAAVDDSVQGFVRR